MWDCNKDNNSGEQLLNTCVLYTVLGDSDFN